MKTQISFKGLTSFLLFILTVIMTSCKTGTSVEETPIDSKPSIIGEWRYLRDTIWSYGGGKVTIQTMEFDPGLTMTFGKNNEGTDQGEKIQYEFNGVDLTLAYYQREPAESLDIKVIKLTKDKMVKYYDWVTMKDGQKQGLEIVEHLERIK